jgi:hypothetical protein
MYDLALSMSFSMSFPAPALPDPRSCWLTLGLGLFASLFALAGGARAQPQARAVPAEFEAHRIYVRAATASGDTLRFYTDTGGGRFAVLTTSTAERLGLNVDTVTTGGRDRLVGRFPDLRSGASLPAPQNDRVLVLPKTGPIRMMDIGDGLLGQSWFAGRTWTFDYPNQKLLVRASPPDPPAPEHTVDLAFKTDSTGRRVSNHPRVEARIDGQTHSFLLDTGATTLLTDSAQAAIGGARLRGGSFVTASLFDRWREAHPDWRVLEEGSVVQKGTPMIRVPEVTIAGHTVGPVCFERRPDRSFKEKMARTMDRPVSGALGGSLFQYFRMTVSYPDAWASFEQDS